MIDIDNASAGGPSWGLSAFAVSGTLFLRGCRRGQDRRHRRVAQPDCHSEL